MIIAKKRIDEMDRAKYNPRIELRPGDDEYEKLHGNILRFGMVLPIVWNERTNTVVGGHQRLTVLENDGVEEVEVSVVNLDERQEKQLNIALNKTGGNWDEAKLTALLDNGIKFYSGENRLRAMGDDMCCCGIDGLPDFKGNDYNLCMLLNGKNPQPTELMKTVGTGGCFKALNQSAGSSRRLTKQSFYGLMQEELSTKLDYHKKVFGLDE